MKARHLTQALMALLALILITPPASATAGALRTPSEYPPDPTADIPWNSGTSGVSDVEAAFNHARTTENSQLSTILPAMSLPDQVTWDAMSDGEKALWLINRERIDRGVDPLHSVESNVTSVAQYYADYLLNNDAWGHEEDGNTPWDRLSNNAAIGACHDSLRVAENLAVFVTSGSSISLPVERSIYNWMYDDASSSWGHRHAILWYPYNDNSGPTGQEGFLGIGRANGGPYQGPFSQPWNHAELIVMNVFDPCSTWEYGASEPAAPTGLSVTGTSESTIALAWTDNSDNEDGFKIERAPSSTGTWSQVGTVITDVTTFTDSGLDSDTTYYYRVRAYNSAGDSAYSNVASGTTDAPPAPTAPTGLSVTGTSESTITLAWTDNSDNEDGFKIERAPSSTGTWSQVGTAITDVTTFTDSGLDSYTTYYYRVRAYNSAGDSAYSNVASGTTDIPVGPYLSLSKTVETGNLSRVPLGGVVTYTIVISNLGSELAASVVLTDPLPAEVTFGNWVSYAPSSPPPETVNLPLTTVTWAPGDLAPSATATLVFTVSVNNDEANKGKTVVNEATVNATNSLEQSDSANFRIESDTFYTYIPLVTYNWYPPLQRIAVFEAFLRPTCSFSQAGADVIRDELIPEYAGKAVVFLEYDVDSPSELRTGRWWDAYPDSSAVLPLVMVDSGDQIAMGSVSSSPGFYAAFKALVDTSLSAIAENATIEVVAQRSGNRVIVNAEVTNEGSITLGTGNNATVWALIYEEFDSAPTTDRLTRHYVRTTGYRTFLSDLAPGESTEFNMKTGDLVDVNWDRLHTVVLLDYRPDAGSSAYKTYQAVAISVAP